MKILFTILFFLTAISYCNSQAGKLNRSFGDTGKVLTGYNNAQLTCYASAMQIDNNLLWLEFLILPELMVF